MYKISIKQINGFYFSKLVIEENLLNKYNGNTFYEI